MKRLNRDDSVVSEYGAFAASREHGASQDIGSVKGGKAWAVLTWALAFFLSGIASGQELIVSNYNANQIVAVNLSTGVVRPFAVGSGLSRPDGLAVAQNGDVLVSNFNGQVLRFDASGQFLGVLCQPGGNVQAIAILPNGDVLTVSWQSNVVRRYNATGAPLGTFGTAAGVTNPVALAFDRQGNLLVQGRSSGNVVRLNGQTGTFMQTVVTRGSGGMSACEGLAVGPDGHIYVGSLTQNAVLRYDGVNGGFIDVFAQPTTPEAPQGLCFGPDGNLYLSCWSGSVYRFSGRTGTFIDRVAVVTGNLSNGLISDDTDSDGLPNDWETNGIPYTDAGGQSRRYILDSNGDGVSDANWLRKDLFVEVDVGSGVPFSHTSLSDVRDAFAVSPVANPDGSDGITLHAVVDEIGLPLPAMFDEALLPSYRSQYFGKNNAAERTGPPADVAALRAAKGMAYRYCIFANQMTYGTYHLLGVATAIPARTFAVSLGGFAADPANNPADVERTLGSTFMHELGHALGLCHGGGDHTHYKPNYISAMNYNFDELYKQSGSGFSRLPLDFSRRALATLDEACLDENAGLLDPSNLYSGVQVPFASASPSGRIDSRVVIGVRAVDWNNDGSLNSCVMEDVTWFPPTHPLNDVATPGETLVGYEDWSRLVYAIPPLDPPPLGWTCGGSGRVCELTEELVSWQRTNFPPPVLTCSADFNGDGFLDFFDYADYVGCFEVGACASGSTADFNGDGFVDFFDYSDFVAAFEAGC